MPEKKNENVLSVLNPLPTYSCK